MLKLTNIKIKLASLHLCLNCRQKSVGSVNVGRGLTMSVYKKIISCYSKNKIKVRGQTLVLLDYWNNRVDLRDRRSLNDVTGVSSWSSSIETVGVSTLVVVRRDERPR